MPAVLKLLFTSPDLMTLVDVTPLGIELPFFMVHWLLLANSSAVLNVGLSESVEEVPELDFPLDPEWVLLGDGCSLGSSPTGKSKTRSGVSFKLPTGNLGGIPAVGPELSSFCCSSKDLTPDIISSSAEFMSCSKSPRPKSSGLLSNLSSSKK